MSYSNSFWVSETVQDSAVMMPDGELMCSALILAKKKLHYQALLALLTTHNICSHPSNALNI